MGRDIYKYIQTCDMCQRNKGTNQSPAGLLQPLDIPGRRWEQITMDFIVQLPLTRQKHDAIVVFVDRMTKRAYFQPTTTNATAPEIADIFFNTIFRNHGLPKVIVSDRDTKFTSKFWKALFKQLDTKLAMSTAFHPQTDGQTERMNRTLEQMLRIYTNYAQDDWDKLLTIAEFAYNNSVQSSIGYTPFELDCGQAPNTPSNLINLHPTNVEATDNFLNRWDNMMKIAQDNLSLAQQKQQKYADQHRRHSKFDKGQKVLLSSLHINDPINKDRPKKKLTPKYLGPFEIIEKISPTAYKLQLPRTWKIHPVFHISLLKPYNTDDNEFNREIPEQPEILVEDEELEYEVENILNKKYVRNKPFYLIKWKNYPLYDATSEPKENLTNCPELLKQFDANKMA